jgi:ribonuclease T1
MTSNIFIIIALFLGIFVLEYLSSLAPQASAPVLHSGSIQSGSQIGSTQVVIGTVKSKVEKILQDADVVRTLDRIDHTDPKYHQDNAIFTNRERVLQIQSDRSYYHEWTVETPGSRDRGPRRIIVGK